MSGHPLIPVYINSFNRFAWLREMLPHLQRMRGVGEINIIDNHSTYVPLTDWLQSVVDTPGITVVRLTTNEGPRGAFNIAWNHYKGPYFLIVDPDLDISGCPDDTLVQLRDALIAYPYYIKAGLSLAIDDIPEDYPWRNYTINNEKSHWDRPIGAHMADYDKETNTWSGEKSYHIYDAPIDTHFALCRGQANFDYGPAIRLGPPYMARHLPWYSTPDNTPPEEAWYLANLPPKHRAGLTYSPVMQAEQSKLEGVSHA